VSADGPAHEWGVTQRDKVYPKSSLYGLQSIGLLIQQHPRALTSAKPNPSSQLAHERFFSLRNY